MRDNFAVFILTHGRPTEIKTIATLNKLHYTGKWYLILDNEDPTIEQHKQMYGADKVIVFDKAEVAKKFDVMDNFDGRNVIVYARNVCFDIARSLGLDYFAEFEDDYLGFSLRYEDGDILRNPSLENVVSLDVVFEYMLDFLDDAPRVRTVAFAQTGEMIGGKQGMVWQTKIKRKAMNTFFFKVCKPEDDFYFTGRFNDDVNAYTTLGMRGELFLQIANVNLNQVLTQAHKGGNADAYKQYGTYVKSFYSVMGCPSSVKIAEVGTSHRRIHHHVDWETTVPKILSSKFRNY